MVLLVVAAYFCLGVFVVQPIGAVPDGATIVYWRLGVNLPFVSSADGFVLESGQGVSLLSRGVTLAGLSDVVLPRTVIRLPFSRTAYLISTGGAEFDR